MRTSECSVAKDAAKCFEPRLIAGGEFPTHRQHRTARLDHAQECGGRLPYRLEKSVEQLTGGATSPILVHKGELSHGVHARRRLQHVLCQRLCSSASRTHTNTTIIACVGIGSVAFSHPVFSRAYREYCCGGRIGCETDEAILWMHLRMWVHLHKERMRESEDWCGPFRGVGVGERADEIPSKIKKLRLGSRSGRRFQRLPARRSLEAPHLGIPPRRLAAERFDHHHTNRPSVSRKRPQESRGWVVKELRRHVGPAPSGSVGKSDAGEVQHATVTIGDDSLWREAAVGNAQTVERGEGAQHGGHSHT
mmetsp:Transcript_3056/g.9326  ORF Transcript_3056/g.9326 Transcript_3056/m.9326 type:complete len:307 (-) Transcript_3056:287-1207(-)